MDFAGVQCVISYSAPKHLKTYIHRAGRTARAGEFGVAITMLHNSQVVYFKDLLKQAGKDNLTEVCLVLYYSVRLQNLIYCFSDQNK